MADGKNTIVFYRDWKEIFESLSDKDCAELIRHIFRYVNDEEPETKNKIVEAVFIPIKNTLKRDLKKWESIRKKRSDAGKASAEKRQQVSTSVESVEQTSTNPTVSDNVIVSVSDNDINNNEFDEKDQKLLKFLCDKFSVNEITNPDKWQSIIRMIHFFKGQAEERNRYFRDSVFAYFEFKKLSKQTTHGINSFLGNHEQKYEDGGWNADNWIQKLLDIRGEGNDYKEPSWKKKYGNKEEKPLTNNKIGNAPKKS
jgi:hypothetical protein